MSEREIDEMETSNECGGGGGMKRVNSRIYVYDRHLITKDEQCTNLKKKKKF